MMNLKKKIQQEAKNKAADKKILRLMKGGFMVCKLESFAEALIEQAKDAFDSIESAMRSIDEAVDFLGDAKMILNKIKGLE